MRIFPKVLAVAATALALGVAIPAPASAHWDRWQHHHRWEPPRHHHHNHHYRDYGWNRPHYAPSYGQYYVQPRPYYGGRW